MYPPYQAAIPGIAGAAGIPAVLPTYITFRFLEVDDPSLQRLKTAIPALGDIRSNIHGALLVLHHMLSINDVTNKGTNKMSFWEP